MANNTSVLTLYKNQNYYKIKKEHLQSGRLFEDKCFEFDVPNAIWLRPSEICDNPRFFVEGASRFDAVQGKMADCWLVVAMANLTMIPTVFNYVVPKGQSLKKDYAGVFHFRIWQCGKWVDVVVDDRLPTNGGKLIYTRSPQKNEFWSALLEKAYAKLYGSYSYLAIGWFCEAMVDFTGGIAERVIFRPPLNDLSEILFKSQKRNSSMCCFALGNPDITEEVTKEGIVKGHAYSVTGIQYITFGNPPQGLVLLRLRNPWGAQEWTGAWSDKSPAWQSIPDEEKKGMGLVCKLDGEFWISLPDVARNFSAIDICHLSPTSLVSVEDSKIDSDDTIEDNIYWEEKTFEGEWIEGITAGGLNIDTFSMNPQYKITLTQEDGDGSGLCTLIIALMQRNKTRRVWHRIGFKVFALDKAGIFQQPLSKDYLLKHFSTALTSPYTPIREIVVREKWKPGTYCIVPSTFNPSLEGKYLLRVFSENEVVMEEHEIVHPITRGTAPATTSSAEHVSQTVRRLVLKTDQDIKRFFNKIAGKNKEIGWQGLHLVLQYALNKENILPTNSSDPNAKGFSTNECRVLLATLDDDHSGRLSFGEFQALWRNIRRWESAFLNSSKDTEYVNRTELKQALTSAGHRVSSSQLGSMLRRYADDEGKLTFQDFIMCAVELETES